MPRLRIALLTYSTKPRGGVVHTLALAEALADLGQDVEVWTLGRGGDAGFYRPVDPAVRVRLAPFEDRDGEAVGTRIVRSIEVLADALRADALRADGVAADVVHAQDCLSANAALAVRRDVLRTVHHLDQFSTPELVACHEKALREPAGHVCVSRSVAAELAAGWGIRATVIPNGVAAERFASAADPTDPVAAAHRARWRRELGRYVLAVGGIEPRKGTADLVEAMALLRPRVPGVALVLAGGDTLFDYRGYRDAVLARSAELGLEPVLLGPVPDDELPALMAGADVFAFPSTKEGFGLAAMEALAAGVPVVLRDLPVLREVFGGAARFAATPEALADALAEALAHAPSLTSGEAPSVTSGARDMARTGRELAGRHTWAAAAEEHLRFYRRWLSG
ncbi:MAG TPA: MSMEG_0565 family glycosyltransferase [Pseudonocardia sp.]|nr:MSMEG_0565 family glycosyltransferase [Pseudonocardia sp.]